MSRLILIIAGIFTACAIWSCARFYPYQPKMTFIPPIEGELKIRNDDYGEGYFGAKRSGGRKHSGIDFLASVGTPVYAVRRGTVENARFRMGNGKYVTIRHPWNFKSYYCHLSEIAVREGQRVKQGQLLGYTGRTGNAKKRSIKSHLHFELHKEGIPRNPTEYIQTPR